MLEDFTRNKIILCVNMHGSLKIAAQELNPLTKLFYSKLYLECHHDWEPPLPSTVDTPLEHYKFCQATIATSNSLPQHLAKPH